MDTFPLREEYSKIRELGRGTYGIVSLWRRNENLQTLKCRPKYVAIKSILLSESEYLAKTRKREVYILKAVQSGCHDNIIKYYGHFSDNSLTTEQTVLVMEACQGDLRQLIQTKRTLDCEELRVLGEQILCGLHYLHCSDGTSMILHRDLKPENILVHVWQKTNLDELVDWETIKISDIVLKISDYGMGRSLTVVNGTQFSQTIGLGTAGYFAPEVLNGFYNDRADVWSFAVLMHELATKEKPPESCSGLLVARKIEDLDLRDFLSRGLDISKDKRASAKELLLHKFITGTEEEYHGTIVNLTRVKKTYTNQEIKNLFMKLFLLLPILSKLRFVVQEQILAKLNGFSGHVSLIDWENVNLNLVTLTLLPRHSSDASVNMGKYVKEAVSLICKVVYQLATKERKADFGAEDLWNNLEDFKLISFLLRLKDFQDLKGDIKHDPDVLLQHPFLSGNISELQFNEIISAIIMTDSDIIIGSREGSTHVVDVKTLKRRKMVESKKCCAWIYFISSFDSVFATSNLKGKISVWTIDYETNQCREVQIINCHGGKLVACIRMNKNFLVSYGWDCRIVIHKWNGVCNGMKCIDGTSKGIEATFVQCSEIRTNMFSLWYSLSLLNSDLYFVDRNYLKHYKLSTTLNQISMTGEMVFTDQLSCLTHANEDKTMQNLANGARNASRETTHRYFWVGTHRPGKMLLVDMETQSVLCVFNTFLSGLVTQLCTFGNQVLCSVWEPNKPYAYCLCYDTKDILSHTHPKSASSQPSIIPFRQFIEAGGISSEMFTKGDKHVFYYKDGEFNHICFSSTKTFPKQLVIKE